MGRTEKQKMLVGELYRPGDPELLSERSRCQSQLRAFNAEPDEERRSAPSNCWPATILANPNVVARTLSWSFP